MLKSEKLRDILKSTELFASVSDEMLDYISSKVEFVELPAGALLFSEGETGTDLYLVAEGELCILSGGVEIVTRGPGECVGELAVLDDTSPRNAEIMTKTDALLLKLSREEFRQALANSWKITNAAFKILVQKLRQDTKKQIAIALERERIQHNLEIARKVQTAMLPEEDLMLDWLHIAGKSQPKWSGEIITIILSCLIIELLLRLETLLGMNFTQHYLSPSSVVL